MARWRRRAARAALTALYLWLLWGCTAGPDATDARTAAQRSAPTLPPAGAGPEPSPVTPPAIASGDGATPPTSAPTADAGSVRQRIAQALAYDDADPLGDLEAADALDGGTTAPALQPGGRCRAAAPTQRLSQGVVTAAIATLGDGFVLAGYETTGAGERVHLFSLPARGLPRPLRSIPLQHAYPVARPAAPAIGAIDAGHVTLAVVDGKGRLLAGQLPIGAGHGGANLRELARGVDGRFAPAVAHVDKGALIAWTVGSTPMGLHYALLTPDGKLPLQADLTPPRQGAAAATFVAGSSPPMLVAVDARNGMSPLVVVPFDAQGLPGSVRPAGPVGMVSSPTQLAAAQAGGQALSGYTGLGGAATSAIGVVGIDRGGDAPRALVKGTAYGPLHLAAVAAGPHAIFAVEQPLAPGKAPRHSVRLWQVDAQGQTLLGELTAPGADLSHVAISRTDDGLLGLVYRSGSSTYVSRLRCR